MQRTHVTRNRGRASSFSSEGQAVRQKLLTKSRDAAKLLNTDAVNTQDLSTPTLLSEAAQPPPERRASVAHLTPFVETKHALSHCIDSYD